MKIFFLAVKQKNTAIKTVVFSSFGEHFCKELILRSCGMRMYVTGQHDRQWKVLSGQVAILTGHCPLTGRYFEPCSIKGGYFFTLHEK